MRKIGMMLLWLIITITSFCQKQTFDQLIFNAPPEGWSRQNFPDRMTYSNYTIKDAVPLSVTVYLSAPLIGKPELAFTESWRKQLQLSDTATAPRLRKVYTNDGDLMYMAGAEMNGPDGKGFYQLTVYFLAEKYFQPVLIKANSQKEFKLVQYEWFERMQNVSLRKEK